MSMLKVEKKVFNDGRTQQNMRSKCDINEIMERSKRGALVNHFNTRQPIYADVSNLPDYKRALNIVIEAQEKFMSLPAKVRDKFDNDPAKLMDYVENLDSKEQYNEAVELGIIDKKVVPEDAPKDVKDAASKI